MRPQLNRIHPKAGPEHFKTYQLSAPITSHRRPATCSEVDCVKRERGFRAQFDVSTVTGRENAQAVERSGLRRTFEVAGPMVTYTFPPGQDCFDRHTLPVEREPLYIVRGGDYRGNPRSTPRRVHRNAADWQHDFAEHQDTIATLKQRG